MTFLSLFLYLFGLMVTLGAALWAALSDYTRFKIPNLVTVLVLLGFGLAYTGVSVLPGGDVPLLHSLMPHLIGGAALFLLTLVLFALGLFGAGDAKFMSALALWLSGQHLIQFVFYTTLVGGLLGVATLALQRHKPFKSPKDGTWIAAAQAGGRRVPYGIAITVGFVLSLYMSGLFDITEITKAVENMR